jgi:hypothetical protein
MFQDNFKHLKSKTKFCPLFCFYELPRVLTRNARKKGFSQISKKMIPILIASAKADKEFI